MAMNKKELAELADLKNSLRLAKALRWTEPVAKDIPPPPTFDKETSGFVFNAYSSNVSAAWSSTVSHGIGRPAPERGYSGTQNSISMFSTRLLALRGLRSAVEYEAAQKLARIDEQIEAELKDEASQ
jgi:hypothetical protein